MRRYRGAHRRALRGRRAHRSRDGGLGREPVGQASLRDLPCGRLARERAGGRRLMDTFGSSVHGVTLAAAALFALLLALGAAFGRSRPVTKWSFVLGMVGFAVEAGAAFALVTLTEQVEDRLFWLRAHQVASLGLLVPWGVFVVSLFAPVAAQWSTPLRLGQGVGGLALAGVAWAVATLPAFRLPDIPAPFYAAQLDRVGQISTT